MNTVQMRGYETMQVSMTAAEAGHLVFSTLHTIRTANTIDHIIDVFPPNQQRQIAVQLSMVLQAVVSQQLVPTINGGMVPALEIMTALSIPLRMLTWCLWIPACLSFIKIR